MAASAWVSGTFSGIDTIIPMLPRWYVAEWNARIIAGVSAPIAAG